MLLPLIDAMEKQGMLEKDAGLERLSGLASGLAQRVAGGFRGLGSRIGGAWRGFRNPGNVAASPIMMNGRAATQRQVDKTIQAVKGQRARVKELDAQLQSKNKIIADHNASAKKINDAAGREIVPLINANATSDVVNASGRLSNLNRKANNWIDWAQGKLDKVKNSWIGKLMPYSVTSKLTTGALGTGVYEGGKYLYDKMTGDE